MLYVISHIRVSYFNIAIHMNTIIPSKWYKCICFIYEKQYEGGNAFINTMQWKKLSRSS